MDNDQVNLNDLEKVADDESPLNGTVISDTQPPPPPHHGFLEQFEHLSAASFENLKEVCMSGLQGAERIMLMSVAIKLFAYAVHNAKEEDFTEDQKNELEQLMHELETTLNLTTES